MSIPAPGILGALGLTEDDLRADVLSQIESGEWLVLSEGGKNLGIFETEEEARERLRQIEAAKAAKSKGDASGPVVTRVDRLGPVRFVETDEQERTILDADGFSARLTDEGYLRVDGMLTRTGVFQYADQDGKTWGELRLPEHVFDEASLESFQMIPITDEHPSQMVDSSNIRDLQRGHVGSNVRRDGDHMRADLLITDTGLIAKIKAGKCQLSNGYTAVVIPKSGVHEGVPYEAVQTQISGNHLAVVDEARGGPTCRLLFDAVGVITTDSKETEMKVKKNNDGKLMLGDSEYEVPDEVAAAFEAMKAKVEEQGAKLSELAAEGDAKDEMEMEMEEEMEDMSGEKPKESMDSAEFARMQAKIDMLEGQLAQSSERIDARVNLVSKAREILGDVKTDGVSDIALKKAVVGSVMPTLKDKVDASKSADYVDAMYEAALEQHGTRVDHTIELMELTHVAAQRGDATVDIDEAFRVYQDGLRSRAEGAN